MIPVEPNANPVNNFMGSRIPINSGQRTVGLKNKIWQINFTQSLGNGNGSHQITTGKHIMDLHGCKLQILESLFGSGQNTNNTKYFSPSRCHLIRVAHEEELKIYN